MCKDYKFFENKTMCIGHRGDSTYYPENSKPGFKYCYDIGVHVIETDLHMSTEGILFMWHDDTTKRLDGRDTIIDTLPWDYISKLDIGALYVDKDGNKPFANQGLCVMTFEEMLLNFPKAKFNIDLKFKRGDLVKKVYASLVKYNAIDRVVIASFHTSNVRKMRKLSKGAVATSYSRNEVLLRVLLYKMKLLKKFAPYLKKYPVMQVPMKSGFLKIVDQDFIDTLHDMGIRIHVWTINEESEMRGLIKMGVDGIITDNPVLLLQVLRNPTDITLL